MFGYIVFNRSRKRYSTIRITIARIVATLKYGWFIGHPICLSSLSWYHSSLRVACRASIADVMAVGIPNTHAIGIFLVMMSMKQVVVTAMEQIKAITQNQRASMICFIIIPMPNVL